MNGSAVNACVSGQTSPVRTPVSRPQGKGAEFCAANRQALAYGLAEGFCGMTLGSAKGKPPWDADPRAIQALLAEVHRLRVAPEFHRAVKEIALRKGANSGNASDLIGGAFSRNAVMKWLQSAPRQECLDYLQTGRNTWRATPWEYRRYGMYRSLADFIGLCKAHPVMSAGVIGGVSYLGHRYPFLGAVSGVAILAWSLAAAGLNEMRAFRQPGMNEENAGRYRASGENLSAFLLTALGYKGIYHGTKEGIRTYQKSVKSFRSASLPARHVKAGWEAIRMEPQHQKMSVMDTFLFVSGLLDNVLLPFNWAADRLESRSGSGR